MSSMEKNDENSEECKINSQKYLLCNRKRVCKKNVKCLHCIVSLKIVFFIYIFWKILKQLSLSLYYFASLIF